MASTTNNNYYDSPYDTPGGSDVGTSLLPPHDKDPMSSSNPYAATGSEPAYAPKKRKSRKGWYILAAIIAICVIVGAVLGGVLGSRAANKNDDKNSSSASRANDNTNAAKDPSTNNGNSGSNDKTNNAGTANQGGDKGQAPAPDAGNTALPGMIQILTDDRLPHETVTGPNGEVYLPAQTDVYMLPVYATGTGTAGYAAPTNVAGKDDSWPSDNEQPSSGNLRSHPRLIAPQYKWDALKNGLKDKDPYFSFWDTVLMGNASTILNKGSVKYEMDGGPTGSGVLDIAREIKVRIKILGYAWKMTGDKKYADRAWKELSEGISNAADAGYSADPWNANGHFLDTAEYTAAYAIGYDWFSDAFLDDQKSQIRGWIVDHGLTPGQQAFAGQGQVQNWWKNDNIKGNWNCVCNSGLILGALAIKGEDNGISDSIIDSATKSAQAACFQAPHTDGTWAETNDYWYFGTTGAAEMLSALNTATGASVESLLGDNKDRWLNTALFHMHGQGMTSLFNYGDHGPNKFSATANVLVFLASTFNEPRYALYQRDHYDAADPWNMFWYDPTTDGAFWNGLEIDHHFSDPAGEWAAARSSWSDNSGTYWGIKGGSLLEHQTHGDLDMGDFVFDAMGQRWAGEYGSGQYLSPGYFSSEAPDSQRWLYFRKRTEGQNTIVIGGENQFSGAAAPTVKWGSSGTQQGAAPYLEVGSDDTAFWTMDMSAAYNGTSSVKRGIRFLNGRRQMLLQDEIGGAAGTIEWHVQTNASVELNGAEASLSSLGGQKLTVKIINANPAGLQFSTKDAVSAVTPPAPDSAKGEKDGDPDNSPAKILVISAGDGVKDASFQTLWQPQWPDKKDGDDKEPANVPLDQWSVDSHK